MSEKNENVKIQVASVEDAEELLAIYAPYVEKTAITFEYEVPSVEEFKGRIAHVLQRFPYLKAVEDGKILGYAYVSPFKERAAYGWSVETSIYVDENVKHKGVGRKLHEVMEESMSHLFEGLKVTIVGDETVLYCVCYEIVCVVLSCSLLFVFSLCYPLHSPTILTSILPFCHFPSSILIPFSNSSIP